MKRLFDVLFSFIVLIVFLPIGIIIALVILLSSPGGIFYKQERIGKNGIPFMLFKFRSMRTNSDQSGSLTVGMKDSRITKIGVFIRKYKLDEFPQFINVFFGAMSVVGPRPEVKEFVDLYTEKQRKILEVKPGITDYASLEYFNENEVLAQSSDPKKTYIEDVMPHKIMINQKYLRRPTLSHDISIIAKTVKRIVFN